MFLLVKYWHPEILTQFDFAKVLESQEYTKQDFDVVQSYNPNKGDLW
jgi:hypothetical protein